MRMPNSKDQPDGKISTSNSTSIGNTGPARTKMPASGRIRRDGTKPPITRPRNAAELDAAIMGDGNDLEQAETSADEEHNPFEM